MSIVFSVLLDWNKNTVIGHKDGALCVTYEKDGVQCATTNTMHMPETKKYGYKKLWSAYVVQFVQLYVFPIVDVFLSLDNYQTKFYSVSHTVLCSLAFSSYMLICSPFSSSPLLSISGSILSPMSMLAGSRDGRVTNSMSIYIFTSQAQPTAIRFHTWRILRPRFFA